MQQKPPIGLFDSGVGGLSVWKEIIKQLPFEDTVYFADNLNCPYGSKTTDEIINLSVKNTQFLVDCGCKIIVVACNTATANAIHELRQIFKIPIVGIEPAIKPAALNTKSKKVGVLATRGTFNGKLFIETSSKFADDITVIRQIGEGLVELVENNEFTTPDAEEVLTKHIKPMLDAGVDKIVLGCTHYPFLIPAIRKIIPDYIDIIDPAPAVAARVQFILNQNNMLEEGLEGVHRFFASGRTDVLAALVNGITGTFPTVKEFTPYTNPRT